MARNTKSQFLLVYRSIIQNEHGKILIIKRSNAHQYNPNKWELPGNKTKFEDGSELSIEKIINLETGLVVESVSNAFFIQRRLVTEKGKYKGYIYVEITGEARYLAGEVKVGSDHTDFRWEEIGEILNYDLSLESRKTLSQFASTINEKNNTSVLMVARIIIKKDGKILFLKRSNSETYGGKWELPGGKLDHFEIIGELAKREVFEETGLITQVEKQAIYVNSHVVSHGKYRGFSAIETISEAKLIAGKIKLNTEHNEYKWVSPKDIFKLDLVEHIRLPLTEIFLQNPS